MVTQSEHVVRHATDAVAAGAIVTSLVGWLPPVAALLGIVWYILQIYSWIENRWRKRKSP
jgi:hypothetical protein